MLVYPGVDGLFVKQRNLFDSQLWSQGHAMLRTGAGFVTPRTSRVISSGSKSLSRRVLPSHASVWVKLSEWWIDVWVFEPVKPSDLDFFGGVSKLAMWMSAYQSCLGGSHRLIDLYQKWIQSFVASPSRRKVDSRCCFHTPRTSPSDQITCLSIETIEPKKKRR